MSNEQSHIPVLYHELLDLLQIKPGGHYLDGTVGAGGHAAGILEASAPDGRVLAFDRDPQALAYARQRLAAYGQRVTYVNASYAEADRQAPVNGFTYFDGIVLDLGLSSRQLDDPTRGFSFMQAGPLDMRFDPTTGETAADLINSLTEAEMADILWRYGEVRQNRKVARLLVAHRPIHTTTQLANLIAAHVPQTGRIHPATQVFQALRIAVNRELDALQQGIELLINLLKPAGRIAIISFHSLEDRIVKHAFRRLSQQSEAAPELPAGRRPVQPKLRLITKKPVTPSAAEVKANPRSRSAKLRVAERLWQDKLVNESGG